MPDNASIEEYKKRVEAILLYPLKTIYRESNHTYSIEDEAGNKIPNVELEIIAKCSFKSQETSIHTGFFGLQGLPSHMTIKDIVYYKPSTKETYTMNA